MFHLHSLHDFLIELYISYWFLLIHGDDVLVTVHYYVIQLNRFLLGLGVDVSNVHLILPLLEAHNYLFSLEGILVSTFLYKVTKIYLSYKYHSQNTGKKSFTNSASKTSDMSSNINSLNKDNTTKKL